MTGSLTWLRQHSADDICRIIRAAQVSTRTLHGDLSYLTTSISVCTRTSTSSPGCLVQVRWINIYLCVTRGGEMQARNFPSFSPASVCNISLRMPLEASLLRHISATHAKLNDVRRKISICNLAGRNASSSFLWRAQISTEQEIISNNNSIS